jgi:hypothetical protein
MRFHIWFVSQAALDGHNLHYRKCSGCSPAALPGGVLRRSRSPRVSVDDTLPMFVFVAGAYLTASVAGLLVLVAGRRRFLRRLRGPGNATRAGLTTACCADRSQPEDPFPFECVGRSYLRALERHMWGLIRVGATQGMRHT